jgi:hypothetical protein
VPPGRTIARHADDLVRRCSLGLYGAAFQAEVILGIHALLPVDALFFATADPVTLLFTSAFQEDPLKEAADQFLDNELGGNDVNTFHSLASGARHVSTLDLATRGNRTSSARYRAVWVHASGGAPC